MGLTCEGRLQREKLRLQAAEWFEEGIAQAEIARRLGASRQAVHAWQKSGRTAGRRHDVPQGRRAGARWSPRTNSHRSQRR
ncbi:helix-turn-helix domain-containing protein [Streptomyces noursei]|uniref:helix-turn-helix domain-containing protein n=1 Tax=Streptomyces noursei TaxID=1971 RepID=UPI0035DAE11A